MEKYLAMMPRDIVRDKIIPMTYCPQPTKLLKDISSYYETMSRVQALYREKWPPDIFVGEESYLAWLSNDICRFLNEDRPTCEGIIASYKKVFRRLYMNRNKEIRAITIPDMLSEDFHDIKVAVGLMLVPERRKLEIFLGV
jgi:hypothetical protein